MIRPLSDLLQAGQLPVPLVVERSVRPIVVEKVAVAVLDSQLWWPLADLFTVTALRRQLAHLQLLLEEDRLVATPQQVSLEGLAQFQQLSEKITKYLQQCCYGTGCEIALFIVFNMLSSRCTQKLCACAFQ